MRQRQSTDRVATVHTASCMYTQHVEQVSGRGTASSPPVLSAPSDMHAHTHSEARLALTNAMLLGLPCPRCHNDHCRMLSGAVAKVAVDAKGVAVKVGDKPVADVKLEEAVEAKAAAAAATTDAKVQVAAKPVAAVAAKADAAAAAATKAGAAGAEVAADAKAAVKSGVVSLHKAGGELVQGVVGLHARMHAALVGAVTAKAAANIHKAVVAAHPLVAKSG